MLEAADVFRLHGAAYRTRFGRRMPRSHVRAMKDIEACRTAFFGGHVDRCDRCGREVYVYHSCGNRSCPKCHREQTERWLEKQKARLLPCPYYLLTFTLPEALMIIFRAKMCAALKRAGLLLDIPSTVWKKKWVVHCRHAGCGGKVLQYLARYIFRVAITNSRLERIGNGRVTFRYRDNRSRKIRHVTVSGTEFIRRFLQHVLPQGCTKVRYYGIWSNASRHSLKDLRLLFSGFSSEEVIDSDSDPSPHAFSPQRCCPYCKVGHLIQIEILHRQWRAPP